MQKKKRYSCLNVLLIFIQIAVVSAFVIGLMHSDWKFSETYLNSAMVNCHLK